MRKNSIFSFLFSLIAMLCFGTAAWAEATMPKLTNDENGKVLYRIKCVGTNGYAVYNGAGTHMSTTQNVGEATLFYVLDAGVGEVTTLNSLGEDGKALGLWICNNVDKKCVAKSNSWKDVAESVTAKDPAWFLLPRTNGEQEGFLIHYTNYTKGDRAFAVGSNGNIDYTDGTSFGGYGWSGVALDSPNALFVFEEFVPEVDMTDLVANAMIAQGASKVDLPGWTADKDLVAEGASKYNFTSGIFRAFNGSFKANQTITVPAPGYYKFEMQAGGRNGSIKDCQNLIKKGSNTYIYANDAVTTCKHLLDEMEDSKPNEGTWYEALNGKWFPDAGDGVAKAFKLGHYHNSVIVEVGEDCQLELGFYHVNEGGDSYGAFYNSHLTQLNGISEETYGVLYEEVRNTIQDEEEELYPQNFEYIDTLMTLSETLSYELMDNGFLSVQSYLEFVEAYETVKQSIEGYKAVAAAIAAADAKAEVLPEAARAAYDEAISGVKDMYENGAIENDEIELAIAQANAAVYIAATNGAKPGTDLTYLLNNTTFDENGDPTGWDKNVWTGNTLAAKDGVVRAFESQMNISQTIYVAPGTYVFSANAVGRGESNNATIAKYNAGDEQLENGTYIYVNDMKAQAPQIISAMRPEKGEGTWTEVKDAEGTTIGWIADNAKSTNQAFAEGLYPVVKLIVEVEEEGELTLGLCHEGTEGGHYACFDNVKFEVWAPEVEELTVNTAYGEDYSTCVVTAEPLTEGNTLYYCLNYDDEEATELEYQLYEGPITLAWTEGKAGEDGVCKFVVIIEERDAKGYIVAQGAEEVSLVAPRPEVSIEVKYNEDNSVATAYVFGTQEDSQLLYTLDADDEEAEYQLYEGPVTLPWMESRADEFGIAHYNFGVQEVVVDEEYNMTVVAEGFEQISLQKPFVEPEKPEIAYSELVADGETDLYIYNVEGEGFVTPGNDWGTRATISKSAGTIYHISVEEGGTYRLKNLKNGKSLFIVNNTNIEEVYTDNDTMESAATWTITPNEDDTYAIANTFFPELSLAVGGNNNLHLTEKGDKWAFVTPADYEKYLEDAAEYLEYQKIIDAQEKAAKMLAELGKTNVYTQEAYYAFLEKYPILDWADAGRDIDVAAVNAAYAANFAVTDWRAANDIDDLLTSAWEGADGNFGGKYYINTWSTEGEGDGSNFKVPFFEYYTDNGNSLGANTMTATVTGLVPNHPYEVSSWTRTRIKDGAEAPVYGISFQVGDGEAVNACVGEQVGDSKMYLAEISAQGMTDEEGKLTISYIVDADNNISWLSWKNVWYSYVEPVEDTELPETNILVNGNAAGEYGEVPCAVAKVNVGENAGAILPASIEVVDGTHVFAVHAGAKTADAWDNQFWIQAPQTFEVRGTLKLSFKYKAEVEAPVSVQKHKKPSEYIDGFTNLTFTTEWKEFAGEITIADEAFQSIAFNLNDLADANTYYFDDLVMEYTAPEPITITEENLLVNGDAESEYGDVVCVWSKELGNNDNNPHPAYIEERAGNKLFVVRATDKAKEEWDNQLWLMAPRAFNVGEKFTITFAYKAASPARIATQAHLGTAGAYKYWACIGDVNFTTEWQVFHQVVTVTNDMNGMQSIAFNLNSNGAQANTYYIDNVVWQAGEWDTSIETPAEFSDEEDLGTMIVLAEAWEGWEDYPAWNPQGKDYAVNITFEDGKITVANFGGVEGYDLVVEYDEESKTITAISGNQMADGWIKYSEEGGIYAYAGDYSSLDFEYGYMVICLYNNASELGYLYIEWDPEKDGPNAINNIVADGKQVIYNINGQRLNKAQKGLNIINGKKVMVK